MKKKILSLLFAASMMSMSASSQTIKDNIDKLAKDKSTKDRAAKADVLIQKKTIFDATQIKVTPVKVVSKTPAAPILNKTKFKKHTYKKKRKTSYK